MIIYSSNDYDYAYRRCTLWFILTNISFSSIFAIPAKAEQKKNLKKNLKKRKIN